MCRNDSGRALIDTGRAQIVLATGLGKTIVMAEVVADLLRDNRIAHGRVLVLGTHTIPCRSACTGHSGINFPKWVSTHQLAESEFPASGMESRSRPSKRVCQPGTTPRFGLILVDEAHHIGAEMFQKTIQELNPPMLGGVTATPWRGDGYDIDEILARPSSRSASPKDSSKASCPMWITGCSRTISTGKPCRRCRKHHYSHQSTQQRSSFPREMRKPLVS